MSLTPVIVHWLKPDAECSLICAVFGKSISIESSVESIKLKEKMTLHLTMRMELILRALVKVIRRLELPFRAYRGTACRTLCICYSHETGFASRIPQSDLRNVDVSAASFFSPKERNPFLLALPCT